MSPECRRQHLGRGWLPRLLPTQARVSAPSSAGAARILHPQPLLRHVPVRPGVAHPGAERPSTLLSLLEVSLPGTRLSFPSSAWAACPPATPSLLGPSSSLPFGDLFSRAFFPSFSRTASPIKEGPFSGSANHNLHPCRSALKAATALSIVDVTQMFINR